MVFVEYESEVEEELARVRALLEKLRIDAEVRVFWLACGQLDTYERIINGKGSSIDCEIVVGDALRDEEWWNDLEDFRGQSEPMTNSQEFTHLAHIITSTAGRPGVYNPHEETESRRRRSSVLDLPGMPKKPNIGSLSKMGINIGMHTHHLNEEVFEDSDSDYETSSDTDSPNTVRSITDPLLRESSSSNASRGQPSPPRTSGNGSFDTITGHGYMYSNNGIPSLTPSYGTMSSQPPSMAQHRYNSVFSPTPRLGEVDLDATPRANNRQRSSFKMEIKSIESFPNLDQLARPEAHRSNYQPSSSTATSSVARYSGDDDTSTPRPGISRQSSAARFSSRPVPEMRITTEEGSSQIGFATTNFSSPTTPRMDRPSFSRQSSLNVPSQPLPGSRRNMVGGGGGPRAISYIEQPTYYSRASTTRSRYQSRSRRESKYPNNHGQGDVSLNMPDLVQSYRAGADLGSTEGAPYSTQGVALSFNDLPSRAQHLILNELMKQNSKDTAVLLSTLPIPNEGTYMNVDSTIQYLSDVELLCHDLPPALMVLSNNMTVTVSL